MLSCGGTDGWLETDGNPVWLRPGHYDVGEIGRDAGITERIPNGGHIPTHKAVEDAQVERVASHLPLATVVTLRRAQGTGNAPRSGAPAAAE